MDQGTVVSIENVSKLYTLDSRQRQDLLGGVSAAWGRVFNQNNVVKSEAFRALNNVSGQVKSGEVLGIIGRNGAGKSTLLKVLAGVTPPSAGVIHVRGRLSALLELGLGFHPELTGRENVFLNGAILGLSRKEIAEKFNQIASFAEIGEFIDVPVKRYSNGMYVRLGFAIMAHVDPDILIADEVLAVGDASFQKRCLGQISNAASSNRAAILVSHDLRVIQSLCTRVWVMEKGEIIYDGPTSRGIDRYHNMINRPERSALTHFDPRTWSNREGDGSAAFIAVAFEDKDQVECTELKMGEPIVIRMKVRFERLLHSPEISIAIFDAQGNALFSSKLSDSQTLIDRQPGCVDLSVEIPPMLMPGDYFATLSIWRNSEMFDVIHRIPAFTINPFATSDQYLPDPRWGSFFFRLPWVETIQEAIEPAGIPQGSTEPAGIPQDSSAPAGIPEDSSDPAESMKESVEPAESIDTTGTLSETCRH